ncbi:hypothetical protein psal_cds_522 [Pandoravirus salinus]|uniref:Ankyrin repeat domain containing protein n=1 Tax=Pandoravirus salinus TaxID=1349410 RepID=S4W1N4_9VIRU|nr:hypothetical protein psal_cds_522 [Pandoravirus salinus]AGO84347.1 hypothetical protein psal_cds_522 [Pandoravirus salinus]
MEVSRIVDLPDELVLAILDIVDDATFCALRLAHPRFDLYDDAQVERKRKVPHWATRDPAALCARGIAGGVRLWLDGEHRFTDDDILGAVRAGHVDVAALFCERISILDYKARVASISSGSIGMVRLVGASSNFTVDDVNKAVLCGSAEVVCFLATKVTDRWPMSVMSAAAAQGDLAVVRTVWRHHSECMSVAAVDAALEANHTDVSLFFAAEAVDPALVAARALRVCNMDVIAELHAHFATPAHIADAIVVAARHGHVGVISTLASRCTDPWAICRAACEAIRCGNTEAALMLVERCSVPDLADVLLAAARCDRRKIVLGFVHRCPARGVVCALRESIKRGSDRVAPVLLRHCPRHTFKRRDAHKAMVSAATSGMKRTVAMLYDGDDHDDALFADAVAGASGRGHAEVVRFFMRKRPRSSIYTTALCTAAEAQHAKVAQLFSRHDVDPMHALARLVHGGRCESIALLAAAYGDRLWPVDCAAPSRDGRALSTTDVEPTPEPIGSVLDGADPTKTVCRRCRRQCKQWLVCVALDGARVPMIAYLVGMWGWGFVTPN